MNEAGVRVAALAAAVALIAGAFLIRSRIDDDGSGSGNGDGGGSDARTLVCPPELEDACRTVGGDFEVVVEDTLTTADGLVDADRAAAVEGDLWLTTVPWVEAVDGTRESENKDPLLGQSSEVVARSPVMLVVGEDRAGAFEAACGGTIRWLCVGDAAEQPWSDFGGDPSWGPVRAGMTDPTTAGGLSVLGNAVAGYFETEQYASNDFDGTLSNWLRGLARSAEQGGADNPVDRMIVGGPGVYAAVGALEVDARVAVERPGFRVMVPEPVATADLVVVPIGDTDPDEATELASDGNLLAPLAELGWRVPDHEPARGVDPGLELPRGDGLPDGAVLRVLLTRWLEL